MNLTDFVPTSILPLCVIIVIVLLFLYWFVKVVQFYLLISRSKKAGNIVSQKNYLSNLVDAYLDEPANPNILGNLSSVSPLIYDFFKSILYYNDQKIQFEFPVLLSHLEDKYLNRFERIKATIPLFIILGLLGTLFGLAGSFADLPNLLGARSSLPVTLTQNLLGNLKNAFSPSILGVFFSVLAFLVVKGLNIYYSEFWYKFRAFVNEEVQKNFTITATSSWIEMLKRTSSQIDETSRELNDSLSRVFKGFNSDVDKLSTATKDLISGIESNKNAYGFLLNNLETISGYSNNLKEALSTVNTSIASVDSMIKNQENTSAKTAADINIVSGALVSASNSTAALTAKLEELLKQRYDHVLSFIHEIKNSNIALEEKIGNTFESLGVQINQLNSDLPLSLKGVSEEIAKLDTPLKKTADEIDRSFNNFIKFTSDNAISINSALATLKDPFETSTTNITEKFDEVIRQFNVNNNQLFTDFSEIKLPFFAISDTIENNLKSFLASTTQLNEKLIAEIKNIKITVTPITHLPNSRNSGTYNYDDNKILQELSGINKNITLLINSISNQNYRKNSVFSRFIKWMNVFSKNKAKDDQTNTLSERKPGNENLQDSNITDGENYQDQAVSLTTITNSNGYSTPHSNLKKTNKMKKYLNYNKRKYPK